MSAAVTPFYPAAPREKLLSVAAQCRRGQNNSRESIAAEIERGDLWGEDGYPKTYWHCLATVPPDGPNGRRGQWQAVPPQRSMQPFEPAQWVWQDWGSERVRIARQAPSETPTAGVRTIDAKSVPGKPPFRPMVLWEGRHGPWQLSATRLESDPVPHLIATHSETAIVHAERVAARTPGDVKRWADGLPSTIEQGTLA